MNPTANFLLLLVLTVVAANLPFVNERFMALVALKGGMPKSMTLRLVELAVFYGLVGAIAYALEASQGRVHVQGWQFYAVTLALFLVAAYPGFVWRYLYRKRRPVVGASVGQTRESEAS